MIEPRDALDIQQLDRHWSGVAEPEQQLGGRGAATGETGGGRGAGRKRDGQKERTRKKKRWQVEPVKERKEKRK